jgi:tocopherol O-methyltransferase
MDYNVAVKTGFAQGLSKAQTLRDVGRFYDLGSPYYLRVWGEHIHDGYYTTGKESKRQAQVKLVQLLASEANIARGDAVLDVGCGMGGSSIWLANYVGATTVGITISSEQARIAVERAGQQEAESSFMLMDAEQMAFRSERPIFDSIWAVAVMTHLRDQQSFLATAFRLLKKGGRFIIFDWMLGPDVDDDGNDPIVEQVSTGMLLSSLHKMQTYLDWLSDLSAEVTYARDITGRTIGTWDAAFSTLTDPKVWKLALKATHEERSLLLPFMKGLGPMKQAMLQGKIISGAIVAQQR